MGRPKKNKPLSKSELESQMKKLQQQIDGFPNEDADDEEVGSEKSDEALGEYWDINIKQIVDINFKLCFEEVWTLEHYLS